MVESSAIHRRSMRWLYADAAGKKARLPRTLARKCGAAPRAERILWPKDNGTGTRCGPRNHGDRTLRIRVYSLKCGPMKRAREG